MQFTIQAFFWTTSLALLACSPRNKIIEEASSPLVQLQGPWELVQMEGRSAQNLQAVPELEFDTQVGRLYGSEGCRAIGGTFEARKQFLSVGGLQTQEENCNIQGASPFLETLQRVNGYRIEGGQLVLLRDGSELLRFQRPK